MPKPTSVHVCSKCDAQFPKWSGRCESCGAWGTISKEPTLPKASGDSASEIKAAPAKLTPFSQLERGTSDVGRATNVKTGLAAIDTILGNNLVPGSVTLIAGEPGMGKSTILTELALKMAEDGKKIIYVTGEESPSQINLRLKRLSEKIPDNLYFVEDTTAEAISATLESEKPDLAIIDSIQSIKTPEASGEAGSIAQVKASAAILTQTAKKTSVPVFFVGQVTKDGDIAGPRVLEHVVDTVLSLEGDRLHRFRILRVTKNRFGSTDETVLLDMTETGLKIVEDPSAAMMQDRPATAPGSAIGCVLEGRRPLLVELQALVTPAGYSQPTRRATGLDSTRLNMLLAVLQRHAGLKVYDKDVYANVAGGFPIRDPATDLALAAAIASAVSNKPLNPKTAYFGEIGLTGELRPVPLPDLRIKELTRMGFDTIICPKMKNLKTPEGVQVVQVKTISEALG
ncbi:MAG: DNA repair protein RadA [Patescibacteria group bacterium]|nr:DNA repair protein RadA [Patescibacteria group bacterium]